MVAEKGDTSLASLQYAWLLIRHLCNSSRCRAYPANKNQRRKSVPNSAVQRFLHIGSVKTGDGSDRNVIRARCLHSWRVRKLHFHYQQRNNSAFQSKQLPARHVSLFHLYNPCTRLTAADRQSLPSRSKMHLTAILVAALAAVVAAAPRASLEERQSTWCGECTDGTQICCSASGCYAPTPC